MSDSSQRSLQAALDSMRAEQTGLQLENAIIDLAVTLGTARPQMATIRALKAVLSKVIWPDKFERNKDFIEAYDTSEKRFYEYLQRVEQLLALQQSAPLQGSSSIPPELDSGSASCGAGGGSAGPSMVTEVSANAQAFPTTPTHESAGGPHNSPDDSALEHTLMGLSDMDLFQQFQAQFTASVSSLHGLYREVEFDGPWLDWWAELSADTALSGSCLLYTSPSPRDQRGSRMPSSA